MSLRDQLVKAGLASNKDKRRVERDKKRKRKQKQAHRRKKAEVEAEKRAQAQALREAELQAAAEARREREAAREVHEHAHRIRQIVYGNRMGSRGPVRFFHKALDGKRLNRLQVTERIAFDLRCGRLAVAALPDADGVAYHVIRRQGADKLAEVAPELVVFRVEDTKGISAAEEQFLFPEWETSLRPHRLRREER